VLVALFAASEAALAATNRVRLRHLLRVQATPEDQSAAQQLSSELSSDTQRFIATVTIASNVPWLGAAACAVALACAVYGPTGKAALVCAVAGVGLVVLCQITPRLLVSRPGALAHLWWVRPARAIVALLRPPVTLAMLLGEVLLRPLGLVGPLRRRKVEEGEDVAEIRDLMETAEASGVIGESGKLLIESIFTFGDTRVREVMVPRPDIVALPVEGDANRVLDTLQESGFSRIPIYEGNIDHVVGILHARDVLERLARHDTDFVARDVMREPLFMPETRKIHEALAVMRAQRTHLALVIDEFGGTAGLLTIEDILEELVGEIVDEHDHRAEEPLVILSPTTALADALLHCEDLEERWDLSLPTGEFDTVGGFVIEQLGRAPVAGDRVELPSATLEVHTVRGRRPRKILITRKETAGGDDSK
jgi:putative hemolysin